jgi:hypothetical protein
MGFSNGKTGIQYSEVGIEEIVEYYINLVICKDIIP